MVQPTILDAFILLALVGTVLAACHRGLGKETLHTMMFLVMAALGVLFLKDKHVPETQAELAQLMLSASFYLIAIYVFMWAAMKVVAPLIIKETVVGFRSRFWAGALSMAKLAAIILGLNLWYAVESPYAHPLRLEAFPRIVQDSMFVQLSDRVTDGIYRWLARKEFVTYEKIVEKPPTAADNDTLSIQKLLGAPPESGETRPY